MSEPKEPWTRTSYWAWSEMGIALARLKIAIARTIPWLAPVEARAVQEIIDIRKWQEQERNSWQLDMWESDLP